jgi:hypothetical protein
VFYTPWPAKPIVGAAAEEARYSTKYPRTASAWESGHGMNGALLHGRLEVCTHQFSGFPMLGKEYQARPQLAR